jgi:hypothetical protein
MPKKKCSRKHVHKLYHEVNTMNVIKKSVKQALNAKFSNCCIPLLTLSSKYLNTIIPTTNQIILNGFSYTTSSTEKVSKISFNSKPSFVGDNVHDFLQDKNVHLSTIKCKKMIVLSFLHEWKKTKMFLNENGYFYVSLHGPLSL